MHQNHPIIGLLGKKRSGKDTFAKTLVEERGYTSVAFADALRGVLAATDPILHTEQPTSHSTAWRLSDELAAYGWDVAKELPEVRRLLQHLGDGMRETVDLSVWLTPVYRVLTAPGVGPVVVTDVRHQNEADLIESLGGFLVRITRSGLDVTDQHISETALDRRQAFLEVSNDGDLRSLRGAALHVHKAVGEQRVAAVQI